MLIGLFSFFRSFVFFSWSRTLIHDPPSPTRPTGKHLSIPTLLFRFERSDCLLPFLCSLLFLVYLCFYFRTLLYVLWCITYLTNMLMHKNAFMPRNMCMHKWAFAGTHEHICVLRSTKDKRCEFFLNITFIEMLRIYILFWGYYVMHLLYIFFLFFFGSSFSFFLGKYSEN